MEEIAKIDINDYFRDGDASLLKREASINMLLLQLTVIVNSMADRINEGELDRAHRILKKTEERVARLEDITRGYSTRGPGG